MLFGAAPWLIPAALLVASALVLIGRAWGMRARPAPAARRGGDVNDPKEITRRFLDEVAQRFELDVANLALIDADGHRARIVAARDGGRENEELLGQELDLDREPSGISTVSREGAAFAVFDAESSQIVNQRLNEIARVKKLKEPKRA